ncbi:putative transposase [Trichonephila clavipes]|nr:putative transposase [Trichonephila clavipes]
MQRRSLRDFNTKITIILRDFASLDNPGEPLGVYHSSALTPCNNDKVKPLIPLHKCGRPPKVPQTPSSSSGRLNSFLASKNISVAPQPPYSPDLSPCYFFLFMKLKNHLKGHHFGTLENIQTAVTDQLKAIPISEFHQCYEEWKKRLQHCVASEGSYFEGHNVEL